MNAKPFDDNTILRITDEANDVTRYTWQTKVEEHLPRIDNCIMDFYYFQTYTLDIHQDNKCTLYFTSIDNHKLFRIFKDLEPRCFENEGLSRKHKKEIEDIRKVYKNIAKTQLSNISKNPCMCMKTIHIDGVLYEYEKGFLEFVPNLPTELTLDEILDWIETHKPLTSFQAKFQNNDKCIENELLTPLLQIFN